MLTTNTLVPRHLLNCQRAIRDLPDISRRSHEWQEHLIGFEPISARYERAVFPSKLQVQFSIK
jgi:hypothetical protein